MRRGPYSHEAPQAVPDGFAVQVCSEGSRRGRGPRGSPGPSGRALKGAVPCPPSDPGRRAVSTAARALGSASLLWHPCTRRPHHWKGGDSTGPSLAPSILVRSRLTGPNLDPFLQKSSEQPVAPAPPSLTSPPCSARRPGTAWAWARGPKTASAQPGDDGQSRKHLQSRKRVTCF